MNQPIDVEVRYYEKEIKTALYFIFFNILKLWVGYVTVLFASLVALYFAFQNNFTSYNVGIVIAFLLFGVVFHSIWVNTPINKYVDFYNKKKGGKYSFSEEGVKVSSPEIKVEYKWSVFKKAYNLPNSFVFWDEGRFAYIFPKSCFTNTDDINSFIELLKKVYDDKYKSYMRNVT